MVTPISRFRSTQLVAASLVAVSVLAGCGGGDGGGIVVDGGSGPQPPAVCTTRGQQDWLASNFLDNYFWYALSPRPASGSGTVDDYFDALLYRGGGAIPGGGGALWPSDRYSGFQSTESYNRFFGNGQTLGYGVTVNGLEAVERSATQLFVRYVEPASPAAVAGVVRGDEVISLNARTAASFIAANDFSVLTAAAAGNVLTAVLRNAQGVQRTVSITAAVYTLTPVQNNQVVSSPNGVRMGYVAIKDMLDQVDAPLASAMQGFINQGVRELVLDLRYNGGGLVRVGNTVASHVGGSVANGQLFAGLRYNDKRQSSNQDYRFSNPSNWAGLRNVYVLMGPRTCSASEQVINGLRGAGVNVFAIGSASCGKPVGFNARDNGCGTTYSIVNFESVNARNEGRYFTGFAPTCQVAEDLSRPMGDARDPLLVAAAYHIDNNRTCPAGTAKTDVAYKVAAEKQATSQRYTGADGGERVGMQE